jgi:hypothetical protein
LAADCNLHCGIAVRWGMDNGDVAHFAAIRQRHGPGEVAERLNAPVLKTGKVATPSRVRIPPSPPNPAIASQGFEPSKK